ncbi:porin [Robertkochia aurantiaca]|uniref:porin n=1 Tax=Robertkochia aurantiaca TaxID=2873700 RepID=UPI001CCBC6F3|nr:porin [Robertkochia sp. 3YJGBD-33]
MKYVCMVTVLFLALWTAPAQTVEAPKFGKGLLKITGKDSTWTMKFATRMQFLGMTNWTEDDGNFTNPTTNFLVRRARLKFDGYAFSPKLKYKLELGLSNRDIGGASPFTNNAPRYILDAVIKWNFYENFVLWAGQTKLPGNIERVISSGNMQLVDRSLLNARFNIDRDMGLQLRHHINLNDDFVIREIAAFSQGEGRNITTGNLGGHQYTGRIEVLPLGLFKGKNDYLGSDLIREESPKLLLAATYDYNQNAVKTRSNQGRFMATDFGFYETDISTIFVDLMFKYRGFSLMGEFANRDADAPVARNSDGTPTGDIVQVGHGLNLMSGYLFKNNWELTGRYTTTDIDEQITGVGKEDQYTFGVSKYIVGHKLKVQSDVTYIDLANAQNRLMWRLQMDIHF